MANHLMLGAMGIVCIILAGLTACQSDKVGLSHREIVMVFALFFGGVSLLALAVPPVIGTAIMVVVIASTIFAWRTYQRLPQV